jgi:hypothetical protein
MIGHCLSRLLIKAPWFGRWRSLLERGIIEATYQRISSQVGDHWRTPAVVCFFLFLQSNLVTELVEVGSFVW